MSSRAKPFPFGCSYLKTDINFAVYGPQLTNCFIFIYHPDTLELMYEQALAYRQGHVWYDTLSLNVDGFCYLYGTKLVEGEAEKIQFFSDPFSRELSTNWHWDNEHYSNGSHFFYPKTKIKTQDLHRAPLTMPIAPGQRIIYEMHIKSMTMQHPAVPDNEKGTYVGAYHPAIIEHLKQLGITTVQLMPVLAFMPEPFIVDQGLTNYWGYNPVNFFAPEPRYGVSDALSELKQMVEAYHQAGIEVIVDVVFNHTAEAGHGGPILSFKGFSPYQTYLFEQSKSGELVFSNHSGCGNTVNTSQSYMMGLILDAMRYWVSVIGIDGFRFDLAVCLGREPQQYNKKSGLLRAISCDPVLKDKVLLAEPWDIGPGG